MATSPRGGTSPSAQEISASNSLRVVEAQFAKDVGVATGLDPRVILAQATQEGAYAPGGTGGLNFLNLRDSTVSSLGKSFASSSPAGFARFSSLSQAEQATIAEYQSPAIGLPSQQALVRDYSTPERQIALIAATPWDAGHYGGTGGPNLQATFASIYGADALKGPAQIATGKSGLGSILSGSFHAAGTVAGDVTALTNPFTGIITGVNPLAAAGGAGSGIAKFLGVPTLPKNAIQRGGEMLAGGVLVLLGLILAGIAAGRETGATAAAKPAVRVVTRGAVKTRNASAQRQYRASRAQTGGKPSRDRTGANQPFVDRSFGEVPF